MELQKNTVLLHLDVGHCLDDLSMEQRGLILTAIFAHGNSKDLPPMDAVTAMAWNFIRTQIERENERWQRRAEKNRAAAQARWANKKSKVPDHLNYSQRHYTEEEMAAILQKSAPWNYDEDNKDA